MKRSLFLILIFINPVLSFGQTGNSDDNNHLDQRDGRIYLRLELEALRQAMLSKTNEETIENLSNAMYFRKTRYSLYPGAAQSENLLELSEGLTAYTGMIMNGRDASATSIVLQQKLKDFLGNPTFVRSFAYITIPMYGYLLQSRDRYWNIKICDTTSLTDFFIRAFDLTVPVTLCHECLNQYGFSEITDQEIKREEAKVQQISMFRNLFIDQPHLEIKLENMNISLCKSYTTIIFYFFNFFLG